MDIDEENIEATEMSTVNLSDTQGTTSAPSPSKRKAKEWGYDKLYGKESGELKDVSGTLFALFGSYMDKFSHLLVSNPVNQTPTEIKVGDKLFEEFDNIYQDGSTLVEKTELNLYLEEKRLDRKQELDILSWWKLEQFRYPVLSRMASDVLTIPISTVASESAFSISGRVLDQYRSSLLPETVQALLCTRDWLFGKEGKKAAEDAIQEGWQKSSRGCNAIRRKRAN
nr:zinc finger BED domain-containing protein DAYSLEEPER-like isoform X2 [Malus domestica]XP_028957576.1 zinc finger BED domain-containing protein DAYSLEEPER-like isoform X2 [Malus domestica]